MKIGIWSNSVVQLKLIYDKIINTGEHIKSSTFSYNNKNIMFQNGVVIRFLKPNENARGYRFDISLYDDNVQARSIEMYIAPISTSMFTFNKAKVNNKLKSLMRRLIREETKWNTGITN